MPTAVEESDHVDAPAEAHTAEEPTGVHVEADSFAEYDRDFGPAERWQDRDYSADDAQYNRYFKPASNFELPYYTQIAANYKTEDEIEQMVDRQLGSNWRPSLPGHVSGGHGPVGVQGGCPRRAGVRGARGGLSRSA